MKKILVQGLLTFAAAAMLCSCSSMKSKHYVGTIKDIDKGAMKKDSVWQFADTVFYVRSLGGGKFVISAVKWDDKAKLHRLDSKQAVVSELGKALFLNVRESDGYYSIFRIATGSDATIITYNVRPEKLREDIKKGALKALEKDNVFILEVSKDVQDQYIRDNMSSLFNYDNVGLIKPLTDLKLKSKKSKSAP